MSFPSHRSDHNYQLISERVVDVTLTWDGPGKEEEEIPRKEEVKTVECPFPNHLELWFFIFFI